MCVIENVTLPILQRIAGVTFSNLLPVQLTLSILTINLQNSIETQACVFHVPQKVFIFIVDIENRISADIEYIGVKYMEQ